MEVDLSCFVFEQSGLVMKVCAEAKDEQKYNKMELLKQKWKEWKAGQTRRGQQEDELSSIDGLGGGPNMLG
jgi:hypothetical protein